jgi:VanZ family protein
VRIISAILWAATFIWAAVIFYFSTMTGSNVPSVMPDFIPHFIEYAVFACLLTAAIWATKKQMPAGLIGLWAICFTSIYAASDEFHQSFVPGRTPDVKDWAVDVLAAIVIAAVFFFLRARPLRR